MLNKLARGEQTIMVQHVTVNDGGQASLGQCQWGGDAAKDGGQPHGLFFCTHERSPRAARPWASAHDAGAKLRLCKVGGCAGSTGRGAERQRAKLTGPGSTGSTPQETRSLQRKCAALIGQVAHRRWQSYKGVRLPLSSPLNSAELSLERPAPWRRSSHRGMM